MHPEIFKIPFINLSIQSFGVMMVVGFLVALWVMRRMAGKIGLNPEWISNAGLYALITGLAGAKLFYYVHHHDQFVGNFKSVFSGWGFELLGGVIAATAFLIVYFSKKKMPVWQSLDLFAIGILIGIGFGRIGCLLNGCCYGHMTDSPIGIRFPYDSIAYNSQVYPNPARSRFEPQLEISDDFYGWWSPDEKTWIPSNGKTWLLAKPDESYQPSLKPYWMLTDKQKELVAGPYRCLKVLPSQPIETGYTFLLAAAMYYSWKKWALRTPGLTMATVTWIYGILRFINEGLRDDNPFEYAWWAVYRGGTISQNISLYMIAIGVTLTLWLMMRKKKAQSPQPGKVQKQRQGKNCRGQ